MKCFNFLLISLLCLLLSSCYSTQVVLRPQSINTTVNNISEELKQIGYLPSGTSTNQEIETVVTGVSYSKYTGYGTAMDNRLTYTDSYIFIDDAKNRIEYSILYPEIEYDKHGEPYTTDCMVVGCEVSNPKDYQLVCERIIYSNFDNIETTLTKVYDSRRTYVNSLLVCILLCLPFF